MSQCFNDVGDISSCHTLMLWELVDATGIEFADSTFGHRVKVRDHGKPLKKNVNEIVITMMISP